MKQPNPTVYNTALYLRLSRDDEGAGESNSISTQRMMLRRFAEQNNLFVVDEYIDDGYSGTNFNRPNFQRMMGDIEAGRVNCVVVKDLSRFGRNYLEMGMYTEMRFPELGVRFVAVDSGVDSNNQQSTEFTPFLNVINVMFGGEQYFMSNGDSVQTIDGFQGKKVREGGGAMTQALYNALGASITTVPFNELYTAMQTNLVNIAVTSIDSAVSIQLQEVLKSVSSYKIQYAPYLIMFNQATWDSYPEALRTVITDGLEMARVKQLAYTEEGCAAAIETVKAVCDFYEASDAEIEELRDLWQPIVEEYVDSSWIDAINAFKAG